MTKRLEGKIALVTGATRGIGEAVARRFATEGAHIIALARSKKGLEALDEKIQTITGKPATLVECDLKNGARIDSLGVEIAKRFEKLDILVANAGILGTLTPLPHSDPTMWQNVLDINLTSNFRLIRILDPLLRKALAGRGIFVTSGITEEVHPYWGAYATSKMALEHMVKIYAHEIMNTSAVKVNLVSPGQVATDMLQEVMPAKDLSEYRKPDDITEIFVKLAEESCADTGKIFYPEDVA